MQRILTNVALPGVEGFSTRLFSDFGPENFRGLPPENDLRTLSEILNHIPPGEFPDFLIIKSPEYLPIPNDIAVFPGTKILLITDWNMGLRFLPGICQAFDICFTDLWGVEVLRKAGVDNVFHQPLFGHNPEVFYRKATARDMDMSFCGNYNPSLQGDRNRLVHQLSGLKDQYKLMMGNFYGDNYVNVLNRSRFVFNYAIRKEANMRLYETMACGSVALIEKSNIEVPRLFVEGKHYLSYDPDHFLPEMKRILSLPRGYTDQIGREASRAVLAQTQSNQMARLLNRCKAIKIPSTGPNLLPDIQSVSSRTSMSMLRINGLAYNVKTATGEIEKQNSGLACLQTYALPAMLIDYLLHVKKNNVSSEDADYIEGKVEHYLNTNKVPPHLYYFYLTHLEIVKHDWTNSVRQADKCLREIENAERIIMHSADLDVYHFGYQWFFPPISYLESFNNEINQAFVLDFNDFQNVKPVHLLRLLTKQTLLMKGQALLEDGYAKHAEKVFLQACNLSRVDTTPLLYLAATQSVLGKKQKLKQTIAEYLRINPLDLANWQQIANIMILSELWDELTVFLENCIDLSQLLQFNDYWKNKTKTMVKASREKLQA